MAHFLWRLHTNLHRRQTETVRPCGFRQKPPPRRICGTSSAAAVAARQFEQARLRSPAAAVRGMGQACKRGFAASDATDSDANASADSIRCRIVYSYLFFLRIFPAASPHSPTHWGDHNFASEPKAHQRPATGGSGFRSRTSKTYKTKSYGQGKRFNQ